VWLRLSVVMLGFVRFGWVGFGEVRIEKNDRRVKISLHYRRLPHPTED